VRIWFSDTRRTCVVTLDPQHDLAGQDALRAALLDACDAERLVVVDFRDVTFIDSSGVGVVVAAYKRCRQAGKQLQVVNASGPPLRVLTTLGLQFLLTPAMPSQGSEPALPAQVSLRRV
jgi:anti-anti-sigma factor